MIARKRNSMENTKTVLITGGGTGGHLSVARSFMEELHKKNYRVIFIGSTKGQDKQWFENEPKLYKAFFLDTKGVVNQNLLGKAGSIFMILKGVLKSIFILRKYSVSKVISVGGFSAASASFASILTRTPFYIHEQNSVMGKLNSITSKFAKEVFSSYHESSKIKDYPINQKLFKHQRVRKEVRTIIFLGGSQGAKAINDFAVQIAPFLKEKNINIIHQAGKNDYERVKKEYERLNIQADVFDFTDDILAKMSTADFAVSRAGASTLWELTALGIPALFVPFPYAAANHQYHNAKYLLEKELCFLQTQDNLSLKDIENIFSGNIEKMSLGLTKTIKKDAIKNILKIIE